jgi:hypothetical protein
MLRRRPLATLLTAGSLSLVSACVPVGTAQPPAASASAQAPASGSSPVPASGTPVVAATPVAGPSAGTNGFMAVTGRVSDEAGIGVSGVTVTAISRGTPAFANGSESIAVTTAADGAYVVANCPTGTVVTFTASKPGWTTRTQPYVATNAVGPTDNVLDFGGTKPAFALSDAPEVTQVLLRTDGISGVDPATTITLRFSEPVEPASVTKALAIYAAGPTTTGDPAIWRFSSGGGLPVAYDTPTDQVTLPDKPIWDIRAFTPVWRENGQELFLTFNPGYRFPADRTAAVAYALGFRSAILDGAGKARSRQAFRTAAADANRNAYPFKVMTDRIAPRVVGLTATDGGNQQAPALPQDRLRVVYSKLMAYQPLSVADGALSLPNADRPTSALNVANYRYISSQAVPEVYPFEAHPVIGAALIIGTSAVEIAPNADSDYARNSGVYVQVNGRVTDPAGNAIDTSGLGNVGSAVSL